MLLVIILMWKSRDMIGKDVNEDEIYNRLKDTLVKIN